MDKELAGRESKEQEIYEKLKSLRKYDMTRHDYDEYAQSDYELEESDIYPPNKI